MLSIENTPLSTLLLLLLVLLLAVYMPSPTSPICCTRLSKYAMFVKGSIWITSSFGWMGNFIHVSCPDPNWSTVCRSDLSLPICSCCSGWWWYFWSQWVSFAMKEGLAGETVVGAVDSEFLSPSWLALVSKGEPDDDEDHCGDPADFRRTPNCLWWPVQLQRLNLKSDQFDLANLIVLVVGSAAAAVAGVLDQDLKTLDRKILLSILPGVKNKIKSISRAVFFTKLIVLNVLFFWA